MVSFVPKLFVVKDEPIHHTIEGLFSYSFDYLTPDIPISEAIDKIVKSEQNGLPVLDAKKHAIGYLSEKDCLKVALETRYLDDEAGVVKDYMHKDCPTLKFDTPIFDAVNEFTKVWYHVYPVVNKKGVVIGMIKRKDVLAEIAQQSSKHW